MLFSKIFSLQVLALIWNLHHLRPDSSSLGLSKMRFSVDQVARPDSNLIQIVRSKRTELQQRHELNERED